MRPQSIGCVALRTQSRKHVILCFLLIVAVTTVTSCGGSPSTPPPSPNPTPVLTSVSPSTVIAGTSATTVTVNGSGFIQGSTVQWNQSNRPTTFLSTTQLQVSLTAADLATGVLAQLTVVNPAPGGGSSSAATFTVDNPTPAISSLSQNSAVVGSSSVTVTVTGAGFVQTSVAQWNQSSLNTTFLSSTQLQVVLSAADLANAGTAQMTVVNPGPGGGTSTSAIFAINNPVPVVTSLSQSSATAGSAGFTLTIGGSGFVPGSTVQWNQANRATTFVSATQLQIAIAASDLALGGTEQLTVVNAGPGGGTSTAVSFTVNNPVPSLSAISPSQATTIDGGSVLTVTGSGFVANSSITVNGSSRTTTFVSATEVQTQLAASDVAAVGPVQIAVMSPTPGGGTSAPIPLTVVYPVPVIKSLNPAAVFAGGSGFTLAVSGAGFATSSVVQFNGTARITRFVSSTLLTIVVSASDIASGGSVPITVVTGAPGGGISAAATLAVNFATPTITSITPTSIYAMSPDTPVTIQGTGFTSATTIQVNGSTLTPTSFFGSSVLSFQMPATDLASLGTLSITVSNPGPLTSTAATINVIPIPVPTLTSLSPTSTAVGAAGFTLTVSGSNFVPKSTIEWNGSARPTTFISGTSLSAPIASTDLQSVGNNFVTVVNPSPGGGPSSQVPFTTYLAIAANDLVYNPTTQLLYASIPSSAGPAIGNSIVSIDPNTGNLGTVIPVGSEPTRLALSSDDNVLWVGLNGGSAIREVDLTTQTAGLQVDLGVIGGVGNPRVAQALAVMPGSPLTVAVAATDPFTSTASTIIVYDAGVARSNSSACCGRVSDLFFDPTGTTLYELGSAYGSLAVDSTGIASATALNTGVVANSMRIDNGRAYLSNGVILDANTGVQQGVFSVGQNQNANGPVVPDSTLGEGFVLVIPSGSSGQTLQVEAYDLSTFVGKGSFQVNGIDTLNSQKSLVRWGQDGLAFITDSQMYILRSPLVKDLSSSIADLNVTASAPASGTTGVDLTFNVTVANVGPVSATPAILIDDIPVGSSLRTSTPSQGSCAGGAVVRCNLGTINAGSSATVTIVVTPLVSGTLTNTATVEAPEADPNVADNTAVTGVVVTSGQNPVPTIGSISPGWVQAGSSTFTLTVAGSGFVSSSTVLWNNTALPTTFASPTQLTATVDAGSVAALGWAMISVSNPAPGGGNSTAAVLTIFQVISLDVNRMTFDPFTQKLYASIPSTATQVSGNSVVAVDPAVGTIGVPISVGGGPNVLAESQDGKYLYVGLDGVNSLTEFDLTSLTQGPVYPVVESTTGTPTPTRVADMAVMPGNDATLAITTNTAGVGIFDISGTSLTPRKNFASAFRNGLAFPNSSTLYEFALAAGEQFFRYTVDANGLTQIDTTTLTAFGGSFKLANGLIYSATGGIADPTTNPPSMLARLSVGGNSVAPDPASGRVFVLSENVAGSSLPTLLVYDSTTYDVVNMQQFAGLTAGEDLVRWGRDGLAWHSISGNFGSTPVGMGQIVLVRGPVVLPEWLTTNPTAVLTSISPSSTSAGGGANLTLSITGANFVPGAVLLWNGQERTATYIDSGHLTVAIPASDLVKSGTATLVVNNPGSSNSGSLSFDVN